MDVRGPTAAGQAAPEPTDKLSATPTATLNEKPVPGEDAAAACGCCYALSMLFGCLTG